jgi:hypothetical protein
MPQSAAAVMLDRATILLRPLDPDNVNEVEEEEEEDSSSIIH